MTSNAGGIESIWKRLLTTALVGTARQQSESWNGTDELESVLESIRRQKIGDREEQLLGAAACVYGYRRAGWHPAKLPHKALPPLEEDDLPPCSPAAEWRLSDSFRRRRPGLVSEWCVLAARAGKRAPDILLPKLLDAGSKNLDVAIEILPILGRRGLWLAAQNPAWSYADMADPELTWQTGERFHRQLLLRYLRAKDPAKAREFVQSTWKDETARERAAQLKAFHIGLSMEDESLLEAALDDRAKTVKTAAADLLSRLASSRFVSRMAARAQTILALEVGGGLRRRRRLSLNLPEELDDSAVRDGIALRARDRGKRRSDWAAAVLSAAPPSIWCQQWQCSPEMAIRHVTGSHWKELILDAWFQATLQHRDESWAIALLRQDSDRSELINTISRPLRAQLVLKQMAGKDPFNALSWAATADTQWDLQTSRAIAMGLDRLLNSLASSRSSAPPQFADHVHQLKMRLSPAVHTEIDRVPRGPNFGYASLRLEMLHSELVNILKIRHMMWKELQDE